MERELSNGRLLEGGALPASGRMAAQLRVTDVDKLQKPFFATRRCGQRNGLFIVVSFQIKRLGKSMENRRSPWAVRLESQIPLSCAVFAAEKAPAFSETSAERRVRSSQLAPYGESVFFSPSPRYTYHLLGLAV